MLNDSTKLQMLTSRIAIMMVGMLPPVGKLSPIGVDDGNSSSSWFTKYMIKNNKLLYSVDFENFHVKHV